MPPNLDEQIAERRRQLVMLMAQANRDREHVVTAREQIAQLEQWLHTLDRGIDEKDRAIAETNAELHHLERLKKEQASPPVTASPVPVPAPAPPVIAPVAPPFTTHPAAAPPPVARPIAGAPPAAAPAPPVAPAGEEARQSIRKSVCARVEMEGDTNFFVGFSQNISEGGLFVATYDTMPKGTQFRLNIMLPTHPQPISAIVEVVWVREFREGQDLEQGILPGMGVRFLSVGESERRVIARFTQVREPMFLPMEHD